MSDFKKGDTASWDAERVRRGGEAREHAGPPARRQPSQTRRRRRRHINPIVYLLCVIITSAILAGVGWLLASDLCAFNKEYIETTVEISADDSIGSIASKLEEAGLIRYKWFFRLFAGVTDAREKIGIGTYKLTTDMDYHALILGMRNASGNLNADTVTVTIPEGYTAAQTIALLAKKGVNTEENLLEAAKTADFGYDYIANSGDISRLEGFLFPDTYEFYVNEKPANALERLIDNFDRKMNEERLADVEASGYKLKDIITIASLIEKETDGTDQANIASVIFNRLNDRGSHGTYRMLNIDAALLYVRPGEPIDTSLDSPYNLYKHEGLPPTPIANPGIAAIDAALNPASTDYYYYALGKDGKHRFFTNYADHNAFVNSAEYGG